MKIQAPIEVEIKVSITDGEMQGVATIGLGKGSHMDASDRILCGGMVSCGSVLPYPFPLSKNRI